MAGTDTLNDLCDTKDLVQHKDVTAIIQAVSQGQSFSDIKKLIKSLQQSTLGLVFQCIVCALMYTMVKLNRTDLIRWVLRKHLRNVKAHVPDLLVYACVCRHHKVTSILLKAGADPHQVVLKTTILRSAPHEDLGKTMRGFKGSFLQNSSRDVSACEIALSMDDVVLFKQIYKHDSSTAMQKGITCFLGEHKKKHLNMFFKMNTLLRVQQFGAHSILGYCQDSHINHLSQKNLDVFKTELRQLFSRTYQQVGTLQTLFQHGVLRGDEECLFPGGVIDRVVSLPANQLHHVVSLGHCAFLDKSYFPLWYDNSTDHFQPQLLEVVAFLLEHGVRSDGLMEITGPVRFEHPYIRPVTFFAIHATLWFLGKCTDVCSISDYIGRIHRILNLLPFHPHEMRPDEVCPLLFTLFQTLEMNFALERTDTELSHTTHNKDRLALRSKQALMVTEDLCLYFLKQGFKLCSEFGTIYFMMHITLGSLEHCFKQMKRRDGGGEFLIPVMNEFGSFYIRIAKVFCAYHYPIHKDYDLHKMCRYRRFEHFDRVFPFLKILLYSSNDKQYYQIVRDIANIAAAEKWDKNLQILDFCRNCLTNARNLKELCRATIFQAVRGPVFEHAEQLCLPKALVMYVVELS